MMAYMLNTETDEIKEMSFGDYYLQIKVIQEWWNGGPYLFFENKRDLDLYKKIQEKRNVL